MDCILIFRCFMHSWGCKKTDPVNNHQGGCYYANQNGRQRCGNELEARGRRSEGTLVDEIYDVGTSLVTATTRLMEGMNKIYDVVNGLLDLFTNFITGASNSTRNVRSTIE